MAFYLAGYTIVTDVLVSIKNYFLPTIYVATYLVTGNRAIAKKPEASRRNACWIVGCSGTVLSPLPQLGWLLLGPPYPPLPTTSTAHVELTMSLDTI